MSRPTGVTATALLMMLSIVVGLVLRYTHVPVPVNGAMPTNPSLSTARHLYWVCQTFAVLVIYFYWNARNWARMLVLIGSVFFLSVTVGLYLQLFHGIHLLWMLGLSFKEEIIVSTVLDVGKAILAIYLLWYLNTRVIRDWFAQEPVPLKEN
jgi:hypothetical protein